MESTSKEISVKTLYNQYRPNRFEDVVGQNTPVKTLQNALLSGKVASAYLFSGPRGTGKTSTARIFAKSLLCLDQTKESTVDGCGKCNACVAIEAGYNPDFVEIDAASNRGIDNIRDNIISACRLSPQESSYKVFLIDEVHHLTSEASTALLKVLEEPPENVVFLLVTTEPMKLKDTIRSRCQWLRFRSISPAQIALRIDRILSSENISVEDGVSSLIARQSNGGLRDALSMTDMLITYSGGKQITLKDAEQCFGTVSQSTLSKLCGYVLENDLTNVLYFPSQISAGTVEGENSEIVLKFADILSSAIFMAQGIPQLSYESGFGEMLNPMIERFSQEWSLAKLLHGRDVIERNWWKFENSAFDSGNVFSEIMTTVMLPEVDWKASNMAPLREEKSNQLPQNVMTIDESRTQYKKTMKALTTIVGLLKNMIEGKFGDKTTSLDNDSHSN